VRFSAAPLGAVPAHNDRTIGSVRNTGGVGTPRRPQMSASSCQQPRRADRKRRSKERNRLRAAIGKKRAAPSHWNERVPPFS